MTPKLLALCLLLAASAAGQDKSAPKRGELEFQLTSLGRNERGNVLTAAVKATNKSSSVVFLLLFGRPSAVDNAGEVFDGVQSVTGVAYCAGTQNPPSKLVCVGKEEARGGFVRPPVDSYTEIDPDQSAVFTIVLSGSHSTGAKITRSGVTGDSSQSFNS